MSTVRRNGHHDPFSPALGWQEIALPRAEDWRWRRLRQVDLDLEERLAKLELDLAEHIREVAVRQERQDWVLWLYGLLLGLLVGGATLGPLLAPFWWGG
jgi:hypothetical protein